MAQHGVLPASRRRDTDTAASRRRGYSWLIGSPRDASAARGGSSSRLEAIPLINK